MPDDDNYPLSSTVQRSRAMKKPDPRVRCQRCPNATWVTDLQIRKPERGEDGHDTEIVYGEDEILRAECAALHTKWVWPQYNIVDCDARREAIRAERHAEPE